MGFCAGVERAIEIGERALERCRLPTLQNRGLAGFKETVLFRLLPKLTDCGVPAALDHPLMQ
jgi:hypothetical protein